MSTPLVFTANDYQTYLRELIEAQPNSWGLLTKLSKAAECHRPYLSKVLSGEAHLTAAQAFGISQFFSLSDDESAHFLLLLEKERAGSKAYREQIEKKIKLSKEAFENISKKVSRPSDSEQKWFAQYFSTWVYGAIHMAVSIPELQTVEALKKRFQLSTEEVTETLKGLSQMGLVQNESRRWKFSGQGWHVPKDSPYVSFLHGNWRARALLDWQKSNAKSVHFTVVQTLSQKDYDKIKAMLLQFIEEASRTAHSSKEEEMMCLTADLFQP